MTDSSYIVFWKDEQGQQVNTTVDAHNEPVRRDFKYIDTNDILVLTSPDSVFVALDQADGRKYAVSPELARATLGWDV